MNKPARRRRRAHEARIVATSVVSPTMVRLTCQSDALIGADLPHTDHYVKLLFVPEGAEYTWPFSMDAIRESQPREHWPITRTYTLRSVNTSSGVADIDFVVHGDEGIAGPWAARAEVGETFGFLGPGGAWHPEEGYEHCILAGDEAAAPAIAHALEKMPEGMTGLALIEVEDEASEFELPTTPNVEVRWIYRRGATHGTPLSAAIAEISETEKRTTWFVHGVAEMIREVRRELFIERDIPREDVSISGYWRLGMTEDQWQSSKREFNEENEAEEERLRGLSSI